ncbi:MAG: NAD(P)-binding protein [Hyphomicrobiales bacterium]|nr:NAD(P)-binding protein [Hyphomicrobiales bacterium]MBV8443178.1 NAD(P)-binding protein [Hyphomicrobiales bacterium]
MSLIPHDMTPVYKATIAKGASAARWQRAIYVDHLPPCNNACPAGENIQAWLALAQAGLYAEAWRKYMEENPLPAIHGRACYHPCESACNRQFLDAPVAIHSIDRFLGDLAIERGWTVEPGQPTGKRVLIIGAGPAGLSCAYHLRRLGHAVEIRDAGEEPGGMMRYGIPEYRLPRDPVAKEIARIEAMGVKIVPNHRVEDVLAEKEQGGFDAVFVAIGTQIANHLGIPAMDGAKMIDAVSLLEEVDKGRPPTLGRVVGIIGGGNVAMDAARTAKRLGAEEAVLIFRFDEPHMEAYQSEAKEAFAEGVKIKWLSTVKQFDRDNVMVERMEMTPDGKGCVGAGKFERIKADSLVLAVGQHSDVSFLRNIPGVAVGRGDVVEVDGSMSAGHPGIFAGGDLIGGARTMTTAVGHGKKAARNVDAFLRGKTYVETPKHPLIPFEKLNLAGYLDAPRQEAPELPLAERKTFAEIVEGLSQDEARYEAGRCLSCGNCFECDNCYAACPEQAIIKLGPGRRYRVDYDLCSGCAVCFEQCPCHAIEMAPEPAAEVANGLIGEPTSPARFKVRA